MTSPHEPSKERPAGEYGVVTGPGVIRFERVLPGPIERVWSYLTDSDKRGKWLASGDMDLRVGGAVELKFRHADLSKQQEKIPDRYRKLEGGATVSGRITRWDPPRFLSYTWGEEDGNDTEVAFELTPSGKDVLLVLTHRRLCDSEAVVSVSSGWHTHLGILIDHLNGVEPLPFWTTLEPLEHEYRKRLSVP